MQRFRQFPGCLHPGFCLCQFGLMKIICPLRLCDRTIRRSDPGIADRIPRRSRQGWMVGPAADRTWHSFREGRRQRRRRILQVPAPQLFPPASCLLARRLFGCASGQQRRILVKYRSCACAIRSSCASSSRRAGRRALYPSKIRIRSASNLSFRLLHASRCARAPSADLTARAQRASD